MTHMHIQVRCSNDYALCEGRRRDEVHNLLHVSAWSAVLPLLRSVKAVTVAVIGACMAATCGGVCVPLCEGGEYADLEVRLPGVVCAEVEQVAVPLRVPVRGRE